MADNRRRFTRWFREGRASEAQVKDLILQFSVFSNQFLLAQLQKTINADSVEGMRASKILRDRRPERASHAPGQTGNTRQLLITTVS